MSGLPTVGRSKQLATTMRTLGDGLGGLVLGMPVPGMSELGGDAAVVGLPTFFGSCLDRHGLVAVA